MPDGLRFYRSRCGRAIGVLLLAMASIPSLAAADPSLPFTEEWTGNTLHGWGSGPAGASSVNYSNPGTGGVLGAGDGYLMMSTTAPDRLGSVSFAVQYTGNWQAALIRSVEVCLNDVGAANPGLEIHFSIGTRTNFWQYNEGFHPPHNAWAQFVVDLTSETKFTHIRGTGTFDQALQNVNRIHFRHDVAPYFPNSADAIAADVGIDHLVLSGVNVPVLPTTWGRLKAIYR